MAPLRKLAKRGAVGANDLGYVHITPFHINPFLLPKTELFSSLFTLLCFQTETYIYRLVFILVLKTHLFDGSFFIGSIGSVFKFFRSWCSHYRAAFLFSSVFI